MPRSTVRPLSPLRKPPTLSLEAWQRALRRQFGRTQRFRVRRLGGHRVFADFEVTNPANRSRYRVAIRGAAAGTNYCTCPDFATNTLGTCKHVECVLGRLERQPGGKAALARGFRPAYSEILLRYGACRAVCFRPGSDCPPALRALASSCFDGDGVLRPEAFAGFDAFLTGAAASGHDLRCYDDVLSFVAEVRDRERRARQVADAFPRGARDRAWRTLVAANLYSYQREGALFAARAGRCLIGDEMGLGKTVQAIAAAEIMARLFGVERVLIVCPTSLKHQWAREIARFTSRATTVVDGLRAARERHYASAAFFTVTNYDSLHRDLDLVGRWSPDLVILDEAQRIKNWKTRTARSVKRLASPYAIVLTGTPLENRLEELVSIVEFVDRHRLGPTFRFLDAHQVHDEHGRVAGYRNLDRIAETLAPVLIRRTKREVATELPPRLDKNFFVPMTAEQRGHHEENREIVAKIAAKWRRMRYLSEADQRRLMIALQNMRMSCDNTFLLDGQTDSGAKTAELAVLLGDVLEQPEVKVVVFSQWLRMHELIVRKLQHKRIGHVLFHGGVPAAGRKALVDRFREDPACRVFLATDAGGVGLNLQHAAVVVNVDLPWNPAVLEQRIGRVHRLGQRQPVRVVNFIAEGTIEEGMLSVLRFKRSLFAGVLDGGEREVFLEGGRLARFMESVERATAANAAASPNAVERPDRPVQHETPAVQPPTIAASSRPDVPAGAHPWADLLGRGVALLEQIAVAARAPQTAAAGHQQGPTVVHRDPATGEAYLRFPVPDVETLDRALAAIGQLVERLTSPTVPAPVSPTVAPAIEAASRTRRQTPATPPAA